MPVSPFSKRFGTIVRRKRLSIGISQERLAEIAKLHPTYIGMVERGNRNPTLDVAARIAKALSSTLVELLQEVERR